MKAWEQNVRKVIPYTPGEQPKIADIIKLNTNENPYGPAPGVMDAIRSTPEGSLRLYPDPAAQVLTDAIAEEYGVEPSQVFVGVGSDDVIAMSFLTFFNSDRPILFPDITYSFYDVWADVFRIPYETQPLDAEFRIRKEDYCKPNGGIIFPNPNAPTGVEESLDMMEEIVASNPDSVVIIDEAYVDFGAQSALPLIRKYDNLLVVQTFSKSRSLAGMRIGFAFGDAGLIRYLNDVKFSFNSYTMNQTALRAGVAALKDRGYFNKTREKICATRERTKQRLAELGFSFPDSRSNFIFATHNTVPAKELFDMLRGHRIIVRYFPKPRIDNYLRITVGTDAQMNELLRVLTEYLAERV
jgi:histidinol-phosphate aminotransferase